MWRFSLTSPIVQLLQIVTSSVIQNEEKSERDSNLELTGMTLCMDKARNATLSTFIERSVLLSSIDAGLKNVASLILRLLFWDATRGFVIVFSRFLVPFTPHLSWVWGHRFYCCGDDNISEKVASFTINIPQRKGQQNGFPFNWSLHELSHFAYSVCFRHFFRTL